jgi:hypothetical protein
MPDIIAVKCPNCGANISKTEMKCKYCGAEIILLTKIVQHDSSQVELLRACPQCNTEIEITNLICPTCGEILVKSSKDALTLYNRLDEEFGHSQKELRKEFLEKLPTYRSNGGSFLIGTGGLDSDESLYYFLPYFDESLSFGVKQNEKNTLYAVTSKRLVVFYPNKYPKYREIPLNSIISVSPLTKDQTTIKLSTIKFFNDKNTLGFNIFTKDKKTHRIDGIRSEPRYCVAFWCYLINAIARQNQ